MTLTFKPKPDNVKMNQHARYLGRWSFNFKSYCSDTHAYSGTIALPGPPQWSVTNDCTKIHELA